MKPAWIGDAPNGYEFPEPLTWRQVGRIIDWLVREAVPLLVPDPKIAKTLRSLAPLECDEEGTLNHWPLEVVRTAWDDLAGYEGPGDTMVRRRLSHRAFIVRTWTGIHAAAMLGSHRIEGRGLRWLIPLVTAASLAPCWDTWPDWPDDAVLGVQRSLLHGELASMVVVGGSDD